jgi:V-type H+-transporting ATPase subunit A
MLDKAKQDTKGTGDEKESMLGVVFSVSGPVVVAEKMGGSSMYELVFLFFFLIIHLIVYFILI